MARTASDIVPTTIAIAAGVASWELARSLGGRREAWDDPNYWQLGYPLMLVAAFILAVVWPDRPWRWVVAMLGAQAAWSFLLALLLDGVPNLFPLGLVMFGILGLPCLGVAYAGKWLGERMSR